jgi:hypothetical protein
LTIPARNAHSYGRVALAAGLLALLALALLAAGPATAAESCGKRVIDDWYADGRVDGTYPAHCYDDAIEILPRDVRDYSSAKEDIERALQARLLDKPAPPATNDPSPDPPVSTPTDTTEGEDDPSGPTKPGDEGPEAGGELDTASADSLPVPLLVLAGLALLLIAAGSAGYLTRRLQARRGPPTGP